MAAAVSRRADVVRDMLDMEILVGDRVWRMTPTRDGLVCLGRGEVTAFEGRRVRWLDDEGYWHVSSSSALKVMGRAKGARP